MFFNASIEELGGYSPWTGGGEGGKGVGGGGGKPQSTRVHAAAAASRAPALQLRSCQKGADRLQAACSTKQAFLWQCVTRGACLKAVQARQLRIEQAHIR